MKCDQRKKKVFPSSLTEVSGAETDQIASSDGDGAPGRVQGKAPITPTAPPSAYHTHTHWRQ